jgi:hypothetical protein
MASASLSPSESPSESPSKSPSVSPSSSPSRSPSVSPSASPSPMPAGHVTYTVRDRARIGKKYLVHALLEFGSALGNDLYATGGIPLTLSSLGFRSVINSLIILESNAAVTLYEWKRSTNKIRIFTEGRVEYTGNVTAVGVTALEIVAIGW